MSDAKQRTALATKTSQVNEVSVDAGNFGDICAGAAVVNAMVLNSATPEAAKANAAALQKTADAHNSWAALPGSVTRKDVEGALAHLATGKPSERDLQHLQQLAYVTGRTLEIRQRDTPPLAAGTNPAQLGALATELQFNGAQLGDSRFVQVKGAADATGHWVVESGRVLANSLGSVKVDGSHLKPSNAAWDSDVRVKKSDTTVEVRLRRASPKDTLPRGKAYVLRLDSGDIGKELLKGAGAVQVLRAFKEAKAAGAQKVVD